MADKENQTADREWETGKKTMGMGQSANLHGHEINSNFCIKQKKNQKRL